MFPPLSVELEVEKAEAKGQDQAEGTGGGFEDFHESCFFVVHFFLGTLQKWGIGGTSGSIKNYICTDINLIIY